MACEHTRATLKITAEGGKVKAEVNGQMPGDLLPLLFEHAKTHGCPDIVVEVTPSAHPSTPSHWGSLQPNGNSQWLAR